MVDLEQLVISDPYRLKDYCKDPELLQLLVEYENIDFEDVISGDLRTRYRYIEVEKQDFGLTDDDLIFCDEKLLNRYISIR